MPKDAQPRKLATIVAIDVAGFSARTERDELKATTEVTRLRAVVEGVAEANGGRIFNTSGDGFMLEFTSGASAVTAARRLAETCSPKVRVGLHVGDVIVQPNGDLLGHSVNVAARLMAMSPPGAVVMSVDVRRMIRGQVLDLLASCGPLRLDKMDETLEVFVLGATPSSVSAPRVNDTLLAVLPFDNPSGAKKLQLFSDGVAEEILLALSKARAFRVVGRTSAFQFRGSAKGEAGRALKATHTLDGSVRRSGTQMRVGAELSEVATGALLWGDRFECHVGEIFALQDNIARQVATALDYALSAGPKPERVDPGAYEAFLRGRELSRVQTDASTLESVALLETATAAAPHHARSWAALASARSARLSFLPLEQQASTADGVREAAARAIAIDPHVGEAYAAQVTVLPDIGQWAEKQAILEAGVHADPNDVALLLRRALFRLSAGFLSECVKDYDLAFRLDPLSPQAYLSHAIACWLVGKVEDADDLLQRGRAQWPTHIWMWFYHYWVLVNSDRPDDAARQLASDRPEGIDDAYVARQRQVVQALHDPRSEQAEKWIASISKASPEKFSPIHSAQILARFGQFDTAFAILDRVCRAPWQSLVWGPGPVRVQPGAITVTFFSPASRWLRQDPRFAHLCVRFGLLEFWRGLGAQPDCVADVVDHYDFAAECERAAATMAAT